ncbi:MAG: hypothetical protein Q7K35_01710 [bacterium]|nr:hypothetical protein [bacterium]
MYNKASNGVKKILLGLTTIAKGEWRNKVKEIDKLGIKEIALFLTCLNFEERQELYKLLENTGLKNVPHVHLRNDMEIPELDYLASRFKTEVFNIHPENTPYPFLIDYGKYNRNIYIENNSEGSPTKNDLKKYGGLCIDLSHWQAAALSKSEQSEEFITIKDLAKKYKIGVNHISAVKLKPVTYQDRFLNKSYTDYSTHWLDDLSEVDYVKKYKDYLAEIISIELENPLKRQLEVKNYLEKIIY